MGAIDHHFADLVNLMPGDLSRDVERELRMGFQLELVNAGIRQKRIAAANHANPRRALDGIGQTTMCLDPVFYQLARIQFGADCWKDKQFRREILRDNEDVRVPYAPGKTSLRVQGRKAQPSQARQPGADARTQNPGASLIVS